MLFFLILQAAAKFPAFFYLCCCFHLPGSFLKEQAGFKDTAVLAREDWRLGKVLAQVFLGCFTPGGWDDECLQRDGLPAAPAPVLRLCAASHESRKPCASARRQAYPDWFESSPAVELRRLSLGVWKPHPSFASCPGGCGPVALKLDVT